MTVLRNLAPKPSVRAVSVVVAVLIDVAPDASSIMLPALKGRSKIIRDFAVSV